MNAVLYARFSPRPTKKRTRNGREVTVPCESIETQLARLNSYCQATELTVLATYRDEEASGKDADRAGLLDAIAHAKRARCALVVYSLSRFSRDTMDVLRLERELRKARASLVCLDLRIDTSTPFGRFAFTIWAAAGQLEREQTAARTSDAMKRRQADGQRMSKAPPFGWRVDPADADRLVEDKAEQDVITRISGWKEQGDSPRSIANDLNATGTPCRGSKWHHETVKRILARAAAKA